MPPKKRLELDDVLASDVHTFEEAMKKQGGRKPIDPTLKANKQVNLYFTQEQLDLFKAKAKELGFQGVGSYIKSVFIRSQRDI